MRALAVALFAALAPLATDAHVGPHPEAGIAFEQRLGARVPLALPFVDGSGHATTLGDTLARRPAVLLLGYVRCRDLCALTVPGAAEALERAGLQAGRDYRAVFVSIDEREGPAVLAHGSARVPARDRDAWRFLGGNSASVQALAKAVGFTYRYERDRDAFAHPEGFVVLSPDGRVSRYFFGVRFEPSDVRLALAQAAQGRTGGLADRLLLLCYHFDPATGRYTPDILDAVRVLAALCAAVAAFLAWRWRARPASRHDAP